MNSRRIAEKMLWGETKDPLSKLASTALLPLGYAYGAAANLRESLYRRGILASAKAPAPVVSIGNLTLGGSGKTPLTIRLAQEFVRMGMKPVILTRGYGGYDKSRARVVAPEDNAALVGDEAALMARSAPGAFVVRCASRAYGAELAGEKLKPDIFLLDDGFGHLSLKRDFDILIVDATRGFGNSRVFPAGPLREPLSAIKRADVIALRKEGDLSENIGKILKKYADGIETINIRPVTEGIISRDNDNIRPVKLIENKKVLAFSGIANPASFERSLKEAGLNPVAHIVFPDHHKYSNSDIEKIAGALDSGIGAAITTEKDLVRFPLSSIKDVPVYALRIRMEVDRLEWLMDKIKSRIRNRPST